MEVTNKEIGIIAIVERLGQSERALDKEQRDYSKLDRDFKHLQDCHESQTRRYNEMIVENAELKKIIQLGNENLSDAMLNLKNETEKRKATDNAIELLAGLHEKLKKEKAILQGKYTKLLNKEK